MCAISNKSGSDSKVSFDGKNRAAGRDFIWDEFSGEDEGKSRRFQAKLIKLANRKVHLSDVMQRYSISFQKRYSTTGWSHIAKCPFPDHTENTPSFNYNPRNGVFNCFGCQRGGQAVQFLAVMDNDSQISTARKILGSNFDTQEIITRLEDDNEEAIVKKLYSFSDAIRNFNKKYEFAKDATEYSETISWVLDLYLYRAVPANQLHLNKLSIRIDRLLAYLEIYDN